MPVDLGTILLLASVVVFTAASPGSDVLYIASHALSGEWKRGLLAWMGIFIGIIIYVFSTALGLSALFSQAPFLYDAIQFMGVLYLAYLGFSFLRSAFLRSEKIKIEQKDKETPKKIFWKGFLINVFNPKTILFFTAILPQFVNVENGAIPLQIFILGIAATAVGQAVYCFYTVGFVLLGQKVKTHKSFQANAVAIRVLNLLCGILYLGLSLGLLMWRRT